MTEKYEKVDLCDSTLPQTVRLDEPEFSNTEDEKLEHTEMSKEQRVLEQTTVCQHSVASFESMNFKKIDDVTIASFNQCVEEIVGLHSLTHSLTNLQIKQYCERQRDALATRLTAYCRDERLSAFVLPELGRIRYRKVLTVISVLLILLCIVVLIATLS